MDRRMWLFSICVLFVFVGTSSAILDGGSLPGQERQSDAVVFSDDYEGVSDSYLATAKIQEVQRNIQTQLNEYQEYIVSKMASLERVCNATKHDKSATQGIEYQVHNGHFKSPHMNKIVAIMTLKLRDVAEIFIDDMNYITNQVTQTLSEHLEEKFSPLAGGFDSIQGQVLTLAKKDTLNKLQANLSNLVASSIADLRENVKAMATKIDLTAVTGDLTSQTRQLREKTEEVKSCQASDVLIEDALLKASQSSSKMAEVKTAWMNTNQTCSKAPEQKILLLDILMKTDKSQLQRLSGTVEDMKSEVSSHLEVLKLTLTGKGVLERETASRSPTHIMIPEATTTTTTTTPPPPPALECRNSHFIGGGKTMEICKSAVRFGKCNLDFVAFHCCLSCSDAGLLKSIPNYQASRNVSVLQALRKIRP